jgi:ABC-type antimicrobial peptide transport system permease subunit
LVSEIRRIVQNADTEQPISDIRTMEQVVSEDTSSRQTQAQVLSIFAMLAILLAGLGIHGVLSFSVAQRTQEFGVRSALGATRANILNMVMKEGVILAIAGVAIGAFIAYLAGRTMQALLVGVTPYDARIFAVAISVAAIMTLAGSIFPAFRATRIDPATALRAQ